MSIQSMIEAEAIRQGVPVSIALAVAEQESSFNQNAIGGSGEIGVFQLMPGTASGLGVDPYNLTDNIRGGIRYLAEQFGRFGNWDQALAAYNAGPSRVVSGNIPNRTRNYVSQVFERSNRFGVLSVPETPLFSVDVFETVEPNYWLMALLGIGVASLAFMGIKGK